MTAGIKTRLCWRKDLAEFRGLSDRERAGFLLVLEWFVAKRLRPRDQGVWGSSSSDLC